VKGGDVELVALTKRFGETTAVDAIDLHIEQGEFFSLLGPSGCGKTTTLRLVAGLEAPSAGSVHLDGVDVTRLPPNRRNVNTVFQSYALFPFLSVAENVAFGLKYKSLGKREIASKVGEALELVRLQGFERRRPSQLSGGQQQRVALARALVLDPSVLLLDEPLGALDAKLRRTLQVELKALQETVGVTFLYVTHDQEEALTMSDRLAVMAAGRIAQIGTPEQVYEEPETAYVADFLGISNLIDAVAVGANGSGCCRLTLGDFQLEAEHGMVSAVGSVKIAIRPERVKIETYDADVQSESVNRVPAMVERLVYLGATTQVIMRLAPGARLQALVQNVGDQPHLTQGTAVRAYLPPEALRVLGEGEGPAVEADADYEVTSGSGDGG
jgi:spermidine/putrescine transport system ATP-binding protein